jgi:hypothetical protein
VLDPAQRTAIELPPDRSLLVLGEAGYGKTTVLLHRIAHLWRTSGRSLRVAILVPTEGLVRLLQAPLRRLGVDVEVESFDRFAAKQARRVFRRLPPESEVTPPGVMRLKRSPALQAALEEIASREPGLVDEDRDAPRRSSRGAHVTRGDLQHLFGDRLLVERVAKAAALPRQVVANVLEWTRVQFEKTTEEAWSHVTDRARLVAVDRRPLDEGTATGHASTLDVEDYPVLFELDRLRALRRGARPKAPRAFDLIAIDEAQELAPLELRLIGRSLAPAGTFLVSGDADQQTGETAEFLGWDATMRELGAKEYTTTRLQIGYRCPADVVDLARAVRDGPGVAKAPIVLCADERALADHLGPALALLLRRDRRASVAMICRRPLTARRLADRLRAHFPVRVVFDGKFLPRGPLQVSIVAEVKGLEFDYVIVPDANAIEWPNDAASRRAMYVAVTRARKQVLLASVGAPAAFFARSSSK